MRTVLHNARWGALRLIAFVGLICGWVVSFFLGRQKSRSMGKKRHLRLPTLTFYDLYAAFGVGPFARDEWPGLQSTANQLEDKSLALIKVRGRIR